jgi:hypothetical protein
MHKKYACTHGQLRLCVRETGETGQFDVRVVRKPKGEAFQQALIIRPGTVLTLTRGKGTRFVKAGVFLPRIRYGKLIAGGLLRIVEDLTSSS